MLIKVDEGVSVLLQVTFRGQDQRPYLVLLPLQDVFIIIAEFLAAITQIGITLVSESNGLAVLALGRLFASETVFVSRF